MEVTVGAFMFMILLALGFFTIILSRENIFQETYPVAVVFDSVMGLREGDNVFVRGVDVGKIKELRVENDGVYLLANLDIPLKVHEDYKVEILPTSVLGGRYLHIDEGSDDAPLLPEGDVLVGLQPIDLIDQASRTITMIKDALDEGGVLDNLKMTMQQFRDVSTKLNEGEGTLGKLLTDETVYDDLKEISSNFKEISHRLEAGEGTLGRLLSEDDRLYQDLSETAASLKEITAAISDGEGTLGKLAQDDELYEEAKRLLHEIRATVDDLRETSPITTFTTVFFGAF